MLQSIAGEKLPRISSIRRMIDLSILNQECVQLSRGVESNRVHCGSRNALGDEIPVAPAIHRLQDTARSSGQERTIRIRGKRQVVQIISAVGERRGAPRATEVFREG